MAKIAINGLGRIGRAFLKLVRQRGRLRQLIEHVVEAAKMPVPSPSR